MGRKIRREFNDRPNALAPLSLFLIGVSPKLGPHSGSRRSNAQECLGYYELVSPQFVAVLGHIREHKVQIGSARHEGLGRFAPLLNTALLGVLELGASL